jgi:cell division inhibitor SepF
MAKNFKVDDFWMGPEEKTFNEGFNDLFKVREEYKIPPPSAAVRGKLDRMLEEEVTTVAGKNFTEAKGFSEAMDTVFGSWMRGGKKEQEQPMLEESIMSSVAPMSMSRPSPLQVVQSGAQGLNIVVVEPRSFEDSLDIVNHLKGRKSVIVNLQYLDREISQRVIDFVSGATLALDGSQERVGHGVFIFASINCQVETESEGVRAYKDLFSKTFG